MKGTMNMDNTSGKDRHNINWEDDYVSLDLASNTECTGMMYKPPVTESEVEGYEEIYSVPQQTDINGQKTDTPRRQAKISSVRKGRDNNQLR